MKEECLICKAPLEYLQQDEMMECAICHKQELSKTRCVEGHYVCSNCHTQGMDSIFVICLSETSTDPIKIIRKMMVMSFCHMHGPEHHVMVGAALLTAYCNAGGEIYLAESLKEMHSRGKAIPGGACGFWGACGAGISAGQFMAHRYKIYAPGGGTLGSEQPDDCQGSGGHRQRGWPPVLQAGFLVGNPRRYRFHPGAAGRGNDENHPRL